MKTLAGRHDALSDFDGDGHALISLGGGHDGFKSSEKGHANSLIP
jgi:hypothetical protein